MTMRLQELMLSSKSNPLLESYVLCGPPTSIAADRDVLGIHGQVELTAVSAAAVIRQGTDE